jgi:hypothetical protein
LDCHDKILWELSKGKYEKKSFPSINGIGNNSVSLKFYQFAKKRGTWFFYQFPFCCFRVIPLVVRKGTKMCVVMILDFFSHKKLFPLN